ncbi:hypothetical protein CEXT_346791 [Caerostris extrusa]|uniref:Uncharacterized protein n=1 Tax=Caerostris extrusa TaxID=172846 RepID=A0AAV4Q4S0_CAEEX|nr:hypothetical protein CEXT_346791 [Caerostris extrusa]
MIHAPYNNPDFFILLEGERHHRDGPHPVRVREPGVHVRVAAQGVLHVAHLLHPHHPGGLHQLLLHQRAEDRVGGRPGEQGGGGGTEGPHSTIRLREVLQCRFDHPQSQDQDAQAHRLHHRQLHHLLDTLLYRAQHQDIQVSPTFSSFAYLS